MQCDKRSFAACLIALLLCRSMSGCSGPAARAVLKGYLRGRVAAQGVKPSQTTHSPAAMSFQVLLGGYIAADDGKFIGRITTNKYDSDSILNDYGDHGSEYSSDSIFNDYGSYGSEYSGESAFNDMASSPPRVYTINGQFVGYLTTNDYITPRIDTWALIGWLKSQ